MYRFLSIRPHREIALLVDEDMEVGKIEDVIKEYAGNILESVRMQMSDYSLGMSMRN